jgi:hypothetical protein
VTSIIAPPAGHVTPDTDLLTKTQTQSILPSGAGISSGPALGAPNVGTQSSGTGLTSDAGGGSVVAVDTLTKVCAMPAPDVNVAVSPGGVHLTWHPLQDPAVAPAGPTYIVSRADLGVLTPQPLGYPGFSQKFLLSYHAPATYIYTVEARYVNGCGSTSVTVQTPRPWAPILTIRECVDPPVSANLNLAHCQRHTWSPAATQYMTTTRRPLDLILEWSVPGQLVPYGGDNAGWIIHGPGLSLNGVYVDHYCAQQGGCNPLNNPTLGASHELGTLLPGLFPESGEYTWTVAPVWEIPGGRFFDLATAARVVVRIQ